LVGQEIFARKHLYEKLTKCPNFVYILPEKYFTDLFEGWGMSPPPVFIAYDPN